MSVTGDRFVHDVFFSYAWGLEETQDPHLRDWCRKVADGIRTLLGQRFNSGGRRFSAYLDRDLARSGQDLGQTLKTAVEGSAVFVAFVSDYYDAEWCTQELDWFCDRLAVEGASPADCLYVIRVQVSRTGFWPPRFKDAAGAPLLYHDFTDASGQPINMAECMFGAPTPGLAQPITQAAVEIAARVNAIATKLRARVDYESSRLPPPYPMLYFEAETQDAARWTEFGQVLQRVPGIVLPTEKPVPADQVADPKSFVDYDGLVLLRSRSGDNIVPRVKRAFRHLRQISSEREVAWVLLDEVDETLPSDIEPFRIRRVHARGDFAPEVKKALFDV